MVYSFWFTANNLNEIFWKLYGLVFISQLMPLDSVFIKLMHYQSILFKVKH
jgi:hypothetical protein